MSKLQARLAGREKIADSTYAFTLEPHEAPFAYRAGQNVDVTVPELKHPDPSGNKRTFTVANAPGYGGLLVATRVRGSGLKKTLVEAPLGLEVAVDGPYGSFTLPQKPSEVVMLAGGVGITPFRAMVEDTLERSLDHTLSLIHSNRTPEEAPFLDELFRWGVESAREMSTGEKTRRRRRGQAHESPTAATGGAGGLAAGGLAAGGLASAGGEHMGGVGDHSGGSGAVGRVAAHGVTRADMPALGPAPATGTSTLAAAAGRPRFVYIPTMTQASRSARGWKGESRRIDPDFLADVLPLNRETPWYYVAGPPRFVNGAVESLKHLGIDEDRIRFEEFAGY
jgi:ferredoxin-NADP reductase